MGDKTSISWTRIIPGSDGASWNPIRAFHKVKETTGTFCTKVSPGCDNCYASLIAEHGKNQIGIPYPGIQDAQSLREQIEMRLSTGGQTSIEWPLRTERPRGIFPCSMTDWLGEFVPTEWASLMLAVMVLAQHHIFMPLTKRWKHLRNMINAMSSETMAGIVVPEGDIWNISILRLRGLLKSMDFEGKDAIQIKNNRFVAVAPWAPSNILFGMTICTEAEAKATKKYFEEIKELAPGIRLWVSQEPALEIIDWAKLGYTNKHFDWLAWGGESGHHARLADLDGARTAIQFGRDQGIPIFVKQFGTPIGLDMDIDTKGENIPVDHELYIREFPDIEGCYFPWMK